MKTPISALHIVFILKISRQWSVFVSEILKGENEHISVHLQILRISSNVPTAETAVVVFVSDLTKKVDAVKLVENLQADSVALLPSLRVGGSEMSCGHSDDLELFVGDDLITSIVGDGIPCFVDIWPCSNVW